MSADPAKAVNDADVTHAADAAVVNIFILHKHTQT